MDYNLNIKDYLVFHDEGESLYDKLALESYLSFLQPMSEKLPEKVIPIDIPFIEPKKETKIEYVPSKGEKSFEDAYIRAVGKKDEYYDFLKNVAKYESGFNPKAKNPGAPAYGYFQFMQDGIKWDNISRFAGVDIDTFRDTPELQILAARKLYDEFKKSFNSRDLARAKELGLSEKQLIGGAWLAGAGGVKNYLHHGKNVDDKHWNNGVGIDLLTQFKRFARKGGILKAQRGVLVNNYNTPGDWYDYSGSSEIPKNDGHWGSRNPDTGLLLKHPNHETYYEMLKAEQRLGNRLFTDLNGREYSFNDFEAMTKGRIPGMKEKSYPSDL